MNRDDVIRWAREAGLLPDNSHPAPQTRSMADKQARLERFAALVAAHVRETEFKPDWNKYQQGLADGAAAEREACAKVCEDLIGTRAMARHCADAIRARGQS